jgi:YspA, cpYpsA-related SLOG family
MSQRFSNFADLADHYAEQVASPDYGTAFMEQTEMARLSIAEEPTTAEMPDPDKAQAALEMIMATVFDLFRDTRMEDFSGEVAWGIANSFHVVAKRLDDREDAASQKLAELLKTWDPSEVYQTEVEDLTMTARSLSECRDAMECMREHAARIYHVETGRPFSPVRGSRVASKATASMIEARDYIASRAQQRREQYAPSGAVVAFSGGQTWADHELIWEHLDCIKVRIPSMILATTAQNKGADVIAASWAAKNDVKVVLCRLDRALGNRAAFVRNDRIVGFRPVEAIVCSGTGIQANLADKLRTAGVPLHVLRERSAMHG